MKIGDEVYVHGYVDEIRKDCVIIRNDGGYFGTVRNEIRYIEGDEIIPQREADTPQTEEPKWTKENCKGCKYNEYPYDDSTCFVRVCIDGNKYEPKQTDCGWK